MESFTALSETFRDPEVLSKLEEDGRFDEISEAVEHLEKRLGELEVEDGELDDVRGCCLAIRNACAAGGRTRRFLGERASPVLQRLLMSLRVESVVKDEGKLASVKVVAAQALANMCAGSVDGVGGVWPSSRDAVLTVLGAPRASNTVSVKCRAACCALLANVLGNGEDESLVLEDVELLRRVLMVPMVVEKEEDEGVISEWVHMIVRHVVRRNKVVWCVRALALPDSEDEVADREIPGQSFGWASPEQAVLLEHSSEVLEADKVTLDEENLKALASLGLGSPTSKHLNEVGGVRGAVAASALNLVSDVLLSDEARPLRLRLVQDTDLQLMQRLTACIAVNVPTSRSERDARWRASLLRLVAILVENSPPAILQAQRLNTPQVVVLHTTLTDTGLVAQQWANIAMTNMTLKEP